MTLKFEITRTYKRLRYYRHNQLHRTDGPAALISNLDHVVMCFLYNKQYTKEEYDAKIRNNSYI